MAFLSPIAALIAAALVIPALLALYMLKRRRRQVEVSTTLLWRKTLQEFEANAPFQRLRKNLLLLLQLLVMAALLLALARPARQEVAPAGQRVVIVLDHSASMNALDGEGGTTTRLGAARRAALELIDNLEGAAMVVSFAHQARVLQTLTSDRARLRAAVRSVEPTDQPSRIDAVARLLEPFAGRAAEGGEGGLLVYLLSDGRLHGLEGLSLPGAQVHYLSMGGPAEKADNLAIVGLSARRDPREPAKVAVLVRLANYGARPVQASLTLRAAGDIQQVLPVTVPEAAGAEGPAGRSALQFDLELTEAALIEVAHDHRDLLAADDRGWLSLAPARPLSVLLVTAGNPFLEQALRAAGARWVVTMDPGTYESQDPQRLAAGGWAGGVLVGGTEAEQSLSGGGELSGVGELSGAGVPPAVVGTGPAGSPPHLDAQREGFDVIVFDAYSPKLLPPRDSLYFAAAPPIEGLERAVAEHDAGSLSLLDWRRDHPLLRHVALENLAVAGRARLALPVDPRTGAQVLAVGAAGPAMAELVQAGRRHVVVAFDPLESNWPMQIGFPVFVSNAVNYLGLRGEGQAAVSFRPGEVAVVPAAGGSVTLRYEGPVTLEAPVEQQAAILPVLERVGLYQLQDGGPFRGREPFRGRGRGRGRVEPPWDRLAVNLADPLESDLRPAAALSLGGATRVAATEGAPVRREVWRWFAWAALGLLAVEWLVYVRRMHL